jgi:hypothetical protein
MAEKTAPPEPITLKTLCPLGAILGDNSRRLTRKGLPSGGARKWLDGKLRRSARLAPPSQRESPSPSHTETREASRRNYRAEEVSRAGESPQTRVEAV